MAFPQSPSIDYFFQRSKRKLEDYDYDYDEDADSGMSSYPRIRKDNPNSLPSTGNPFHDQVTRRRPFVQPRSVLSYSDRIQFFVRMISGGKTLVLNGKPDDKIQLIHEKIQSATGIPVMEQRLIYRGRQLQWDDSLDECMIKNDAEMHLVGRMRSTKHPQVWQLVDDLVSTIYRLCKGQDVIASSLNSVKSRLVEFLGMTAKEDIDEYHLVSHLNIFQSLCAPKALVMLYMSPLEGNKECAESSIRNFIDSNKTMLPKPLHAHCAPVVLDFCKLFNTASAQDDPLYDLCRTSLGTIVEDLRIGRTLRIHDVNNTTTSFSSSYSKSSMIAFEDIFPFVIELANKLTEGLNSTSPSPSDVGDLAAFLRPIKAAIKDLPDFGGIIPVPMMYTFPRYNDEIKLLFMILFELLEKVRKCLQQMEIDLAMERKEDGKWDQYLAILKELRGIARLYQGAEDIFWSDMKAVRVSFCYLISKYAKKGNDYKWIRRHKDILDFESRRNLVMMLLPDVKDEYDEVHEMLIDRSNLLAESFEYISKAEPETLLGGLFMGFKNEEATGPGVLREWFFLVCQEIFNPQNALFVACPNDRRRFFPNPASKVDPLHLRYFKFAGRVIALALMHKVQVGIYFDRAFFMQLAGSDISLDDIKDADPYLYSSCKQILDMDPNIVDQDALGLTFVHEIEELGSMKVVELFTNGENIVVNSRNRKEYVKLLIQSRFVTSVTDQVTHFAQGFSDIVGEKKTQKLFFDFLEVEDLDGILHGSETSICVHDWKAHTEYNGYEESDPQICWFWKIVGEMTPKQRKILLFFWTSLKHLPVEGFRGLASELHIYKSNESIYLLPSSHTCFYRICFPPYPSMAVMKQRLNIITQDHVGCSFGTW